MKAGASTAAGEPGAPSEKRLDQPPGQKPGHSLPGDDLLLASLPLALQAASMIDEGPQAADPAPSRRSLAAKGPEPEGGASVAASPRTAALARLIGERAFHFGASMSGMTGLALNSRFGSAAAPGAALALRNDPGSGFPQVEALPAIAMANAVPPRAGGASAAPVAVRTGAPERPARAAPHEAARGERKAEAPAPAPPGKSAGSAPSGPAAERGGEGKAPDGRSPDPVAPLAPSLAQAGPFGAPLTAASFGAAAAFAPDGSTAGGAEVAPRASASGPGAASTAPPVREIDVDLSPGGLEDVSMTMRLAGDRLSVVVRAGSSQTLSSIEGARDAIADRLAAIGQPLELTHHPADGRQGRWNEWKRGFRRRRPGGGRMAAGARRGRAGRLERCVVSARRSSRSRLLAAPRAPRGGSPASGK